MSICDFGLARIDFPHMSHKMSSMTDYVATRWYRAPEIIVGWNGYTKAVDVWGIGCILAEVRERREHDEQPVGQYQRKDGDIPCRIQTASR